MSFKDLTQDAGGDKGTPPAEGPGGKGQPGGATPPASNKPADTPPKVSLDQVVELPDGKTAKLGEIMAYHKRYNDLRPQYDQTASQFKKASGKLKDAQEDLEVFHAFVNSNPELAKGFHQYVNNLDPDAIAQSSFGKKGGVDQDIIKDAVDRQVKEQLTKAGLTPERSIAIAAEDAFTTFERDTGTRLSPKERSALLTDAANEVSYASMRGEQPNVNKALDAVMSRFARSGFGKTREAASDDYAGNTAGGRGGSGPRAKAPKGPEPASADTLRDPNKRKKHALGILKTLRKESGG